MPLGAGTCCGRQLCRSAAIGYNLDTKRGIQDRDAPGFNVWIVQDGKALTPGANLLQGITRLTVFDLCSELGLSAETTDLNPEDLADADEAFISSSAGGIIPVTRVNNRLIGNGLPGSISCRLRDLYWEKRKKGWHATAVADLLVKPAPHLAPAEPTTA